MNKLLALVLFASACTADVEPSDLDADPPPGTPEAIAAAKIQVLRGADRASAFSVTEAKRLLNNHDVKYIGVYIGGPCNGGSGWTKSVVTQISHATGFKFAPIYVGQQAASICGAHHVTAAQGTADGKAAANDMKKFGWEPNKDIPVFLDVEAGTYFASPRAATAYVRAWVNEVHAQGYRADVYASPFALNTFHDNKVKIDGVWAASYFFHGFAKVVPADLDQMGGRYRHSNRSWQYAGDFEVSGDGQIDADTAHMLLAPKPGGTNRAITQHREVPATCGTIQPTEGLAAGESVLSCDGTTSLALATDGTLALTHDGNTVWSLPVPGAATAVLEDDGEFAVFDIEGNELYTAGTFGFSDAQLQIQAGELVLVDDDARPLWSSVSGLIVDTATTEANVDPDSAALEP